MYTTGKKPSRCLLNGGQIMAQETLGEWHLVGGFNVGELVRYKKSPFDTYRILAVKTETVREQVRGKDGAFQMITTYTIVDEFGKTYSAGEKELEKFTFVPSREERSVAKALLDLRNDSMSSRYK